MAFQKGSTGPSSFTGNTQNNPGFPDLDAILAGNVSAPVQPEVATAPNIEQTAFDVGTTPYTDTAGLGDIAGIDDPATQAIADDTIQQQSAGAVGVNTHTPQGAPIQLAGALEQAGQQYLNTPTDPTTGRQAGEVAGRKNRNVSQDGVDIVNGMANDFSKSIYDTANPDNAATIDILGSVANGLTAAGLDRNSVVTALPGSLAIAKAAIYSNISNYKYLDQAREAEKPDSLRKPKLNEVGQQEVFDALAQGQEGNPAVYGLLGDFANKLQYQSELNAKIADGTIDPSNQQDLWELRNNLNPQAAPEYRKAAARAVIGDVQAGRLTFGRDPKGNLVPTITKNDNNVDHFFNSSDASQSRAGLQSSLNGIFPEDAPAFRTGIRAQSTPVGNNSHNSQISRDKAVAKAHKGETGLTNKGALNILSNTAVGFSSFLTSMTALMAQAGAPNKVGKDVTVSSSPFAGTVAKMDAKAMAEYTANKGPVEAGKEIEKHQAQVERHLNDYIKNGIGRPLYQTFHNSEATTRFFPDSVDVNYVNHKGTIRPVMIFKTIPTVQIRPDSNIWRSLPGQADPILGKAKSIYKEGSNAETRGQQVDRKLKALPRDELLAMNYRYNLGVQMSKHVMGRDAVNALQLDPKFSRPFNQWSESDFIEFGSIPSVQDQAALLGKQLTAAVATGNPQALEALTSDANFSSWITERGEWGNTASVLFDAQQIADAYDPNVQGNTIKLENKMEADARQSNAAIMAALIGDTETAQLLGIVDQGARPSLEQFDSLRDKIGDGMVQAVSETFTGGSEKEATTKALWTNLMSAYQGTPGASKGYGRGIVVAGLYGKSTLRMYTEGVDFLTHLQNNASKDPALNEALTAITKHYSLTTEGGVQFNNKNLLNDVTDLFTTSANTHMAKLLGFQKTMKGMGSLKAAANGSTQITSISGNVQQVVPETFGPKYTKNNNDEGLTLASQDLGSGFQIAESQSHNAAGAGKGTRTYDAYDLETGNILKGAGDFETSQDIAGSKLRDALAVDLIQGLDSSLMAMTIMNANYDPRTNKAVNVPYSIMPIHDAIISGPDGHLIAHNSYNNISIPQMVKKMPEYYQNMLNDTYREVEANKQLHKDGGNIGRAFYGKGAQQTSPAVSGHFDRLYDYAYGKDAVDVGNLSELTKAEAKTLWSGDQGKRQNRETSLRLNKAVSDVYLRAAYELGWRPDTVPFADLRNSNRVSGDNYAKLLDLISVEQKLAESDRLDIPELNAAIREVAEATGVPVGAIAGRILERQSANRQGVTASRDSHKSFMEAFGQTGKIQSLVAE